jgi:hypothetical protein
VPFLNVDFLAGCVTGSIVIPWLIRVFTNDGWHLAPKRKPPIGEEVLAYIPRRGQYAAVTYRGPKVDGDIPENADLYWRPMPRPPFGGHT